MIAWSRQISTSTGAVRAKSARVMVVVLSCPGRGRSGMFASTRHLCRAPPPCARSRRGRVGRPAAHLRRPSRRAPRRREAGAWDCGREGEGQKILSSVVGGRKEEEEEEKKKSRRSGPSGRTHCAVWVWPLASRAEQTSGPLPCAVADARCDGAVSGIALIWIQWVRLHHDHEGAAACVRVGVTTTVPALYRF
jgi:hypothetical protein